MEPTLVEETEYLITDQGIIQAKDLKEFNTIDGYHLLFNKNQKIMKKIKYRGLYYYLPLDKSIKSLDNFINIKDLKVGDYLNSYFSDKYFESSLNVPYENLSNHKFPNILNEDLCEFLAIACSRISFSEYNIVLEKRIKDSNDFFTHYNNLIFNLFGKECKESNNKIYFSSRLVRDFLIQEKGRKSILSKIPNLIKNAPLNLQIIFFQNLFLHNSHYDNGLCIYSGASYSVAKYLNTFFKNIGYELKYKKKISGSKKISHRIYITGYYKNPLQLNISPSYKSFSEKLLNCLDSSINFSNYKITEVSLERKKVVEITTPSPYFKYNQFLLKDNSSTSSIEETK